MLIRTPENLEAASKSLQIWHLGTQSFACQADAQVAWKKAIGKLPVWVHAAISVVDEPYYGKAGRPGAKAEPVCITWKIVPTFHITQQALEQAADQQARFLITTNELSSENLSNEALLAVY